VLLDSRLDLIQGDARLSRTPLARQGRPPARTTLRLAARIAILCAIGRRDAPARSAFLSEDDLDEQRRSGAMRGDGRGIFRIPGNNAPVFARRGRRSPHALIP